jgi:hypothetical protein
MNAQEKFSVTVPERVARLRQALFAGRGGISTAPWVYLLEIITLVIKRKPLLSRVAGVEHLAYFFFFPRSGLDRL